MPTTPAPDRGAIFARNIDWNLLKIFRQIGVSGGIGAAARALNKQQPSVTAALQRLENHIGEPLCERTSRGIRLNALGRSVLAECETIFGTIRGFSPAQDDEAIEGSVTLSVISNFKAIPEVQTLLGDYSARWPGVELQLQVASWPAVISQIQDDTAELGIGLDQTDDDADLIRVPLTVQVNQLYCGRTHPLFGQPLPELHDLQDEPFVQPASEPRSYQGFRELHNLGRRTGAMADSLQERMWLVRLGMGVALLPQDAVDNSPYAGELWPLLAEPAAPLVKISFMAAGKKRHRPAAQRMIDLARERASAGQPAH